MPMQCKCITQRYQYDELGNILEMKSDGNWIREYIYETVNNRLKKHDSDQTLDDYDYDDHGNITKIPLARIR